MTLWHDVRYLAVFMSVPFFVGMTVGLMLGLGWPR